MKRMIGVAVALCIALSLAACGSGGEKPAATQAPAETKAPAATQAPAETKAPETNAVPTPAGDAQAAVGEWTGVYCKFVGDTDGVTDEPFSLVLKADGTGVHSRDDLEISVTWTLSGSDFAMRETFLGASLDYTGTLENGVLHLYNGDPASDLTYEYVYGQGDLSGIEVPHGSAAVPGGTSSGGDAPGTEDAAGLDAFRGDWNGALGFRRCTGKYEYLDGSNVGAIARFAVQSDGSIEAFIGVDVEDTPIVDLSAYYSDFWEKLMLSGSWINVPFESVPAEVNNGTLSFVIPISKEAGSLYMVFNLRRLGDPGWTDEDPQLGEQNYEYTKDMTFGELAGLLGYDFLDYPSPDEG